MRLIIATKNKSKFKEIKEIMKGVPLKMLYLAQLKRQFKIREDGCSLRDNALKKAMAVSKFYKDSFVAGEDSGLEVDYLGGAPGVKSKRYSQRNPTYLKNNLKLLRELGGIKGKNRKARFRCCLTLVKNSCLVKIFEANLKGFISEKMQGKNGFGYDPVFYLPKYKKTVAQLSLEEKNKISHRAKAFNKLKRYLKKLLRQKQRTTLQLKGMNCNMKHQVLSLPLEAKP